MLAATAIFMAGCARPSDGPDKANRTPGGGGYRNPGEPGEKDGRDFTGFLRWQWERLWKDIPGPGAYDFPLAGNDPDFLKANREKTTVTWVGHATVLVQIGGKNILTDPQFSERASPVQWAGPRRVVAPGLAVEDLPPLDAVFISHDHYDSLDEPSLRKIAGMPWGPDVTFYVPLGLGKWMEGIGISNAVEMDWWESLDSGGLAVTAVPVRHWSKRSVLSTNSTLWAGWVARAGGKNGKSFFFVGDSGYWPVFQEIGERLGPFDLAAIPIGAYAPEWFMRTYHMNPEDAVRVHREARSRKSVAIHWGTFVLTDEPLDEPPRRLERAKKEQGVPPEDFVVLRHGETLVLD